MQTISDNILSDMVLVSNNGKTYYNIPCAFDIETTSFKDVNGEKCGIMYVWQFGINGYVFIGRNWFEFIELLNEIIETFDISINKRLIIYVHNLSFEFQFIRKLFKWYEVFSIESRKPIYAITESGIEFRCSYILSGYSLNKLSEQLNKYKCRKLVGELDYNLIRHSKTHLTDKELEYCYNDVLVVMYYILEKLESESDISKIPLTKTGYVRNYCRNNCLYSDKSHKKGGKKFNTYHNFIKSLSIDLNEYKALKRAFLGGFTHSNAINTDLVLDNVTSYDFCSSYPYCMISELYPMSKGKLIDCDENTFEYYLDRYCCVFDIKFINIQPTINYENYISYSKCFKCINPVINNGRIVCASEIVTTITNVDFEIIKRCYKWDRIVIKHMWIYQKGYLPKDFIKSIIKLYKDKTQLKGVSGKEIEYAVSKEMLNSCYGMCVTDIARDEYIYNKDNWNCVKLTDSKTECELDKYNNSKKRFLYYVWGLFVTAYARRNLFTGIMEFKNDYVYSDTDSIKVLNANKHIKYIENYNKISQIKLERACKFHNIDFSELQPKTINGVIKKLGIWEFEDIYTRFKTLGAKRYMYDINNEYHITIAGCNKKLGCEYISKFNNPYNEFKDNMIIPKEYSGKLTHVYIDNERYGDIIDYLGNSCKYHELSGIYLEMTEYNMSLSNQYIDYLLGIKQLWK